MKALLITAMVSAVLLGITGCGGGEEVDTDAEKINNDFLKEELKVMANKYQALVDLNEGMERQLGTIGEERETFVKESASLRKQVRDQAKQIVARDREIKALKEKVKQLEKATFTETGQ